MTLKQITDLKELSAYVPKLLALHSDLEGKWKTELSNQDFLIELFDNFDDSSLYFADIIDGEIAYFAVVLRRNSSSAFFWLFYMNPKLRDVTRGILQQLKTTLAREGYSAVYTQSTRTASSYERWLKKFGAEKLAITYKFDLTKP